MTLFTHQFLKYGERKKIIPRDDNRLNATIENAKHLKADASRNLMAQTSYVSSYKNQFVAEKQSSLLEWKRVSQKFNANHKNAMALRGAEPALGSRSKSTSKPAQRQSDFDGVDEGQDVHSDE